MRPTLRRSGHHMITVRVAHYIGREQVLGALADLYLTRFEGEPEANATRKQVEEHVRQTLGNKGDEALTYWRDDLVDEEEEAAEEWANRQIDRLFPEWAGGKL